MNRKCAAGTGTFIEEIAMRMGIPLSSMDSLARQAQKRIKIGSFCTVFASTEILSYIRTGIPIPELARGVFESVVDRVMEMLPPSDTILLSGGVVEYNPIVADILKERVSSEIIVPPHPQLLGAYGAALFARELPN
jgi:activator of 2-hydroxyglutaryl-CoA dehydratase